YLSLLPRKLELLEQIGVDIVYIVKFDQQFSQLQPVEFVNEFLLKFKLNTLVAGFDWTFGPADRADMQHLKTLAKNHFSVVEVPQLQMAGAKISSTNVRKALKTHQIFQANLMLNYNYQNSGQVVHGRAVGRTLGFPTANLAVHPQQLVPDFGVYVTRVQINNQWYPAMTQIGRNLTFNQGQNPVTIEANILDFEQDIYGKTMKLEWLQYLRGEIAFDNPQQLVRQLKQDQQATKNYFAKK
ncbi:riboflavin biosynthesis protein RibF, partial [Bombilactobacillus bombi]|uniref:riboflavin biosynthesis protein RibF n=1 Tax=Bombilactobacillus bombi TaxID=1303590 RepID=UPI0015E5ECD2